MRDCKVILDHSRNYFIDDMPSSVFVKHMAQSSSQPRKTAQAGSSNEATIMVNGRKTTALLDTGSSVSTVSKQYYDDHLHDYELQPLTDMLSIECADGGSLPYHGFITVPLEIDGLSSEAIEAILLVVPTRDYHVSVPVLIDTNILSVLMDQIRETHGARFLQGTELTTPWYLAFRCVLLC